MTSAAAVGRLRGSLAQQACARDLGTRGRKGQSRDGRVCGEVCGGNQGSRDSGQQVNVTSILHAQVPF